MTEAPPEIEKLLRSQAAANGIEIISGTLVELRCQSDAYPDAPFLVYWPENDERLHILAPIEFAKARA